VDDRRRTGVRLVSDPATRESGREPDCVEVRDRLAEYVLSAFPPEEMEPVERHLAWCAGCRKETAELTAGAATVGLAADLSEPSADLEETVVRRIRAVAGAHGRSRRKGRTRTRTRAAVIIAAALAVAMGLGWVSTVAQLQKAQDARNASEQQMRAVAERFSKFAETLLRGRAPHTGEAARTFQLLPGVRQQGGGWAMVYTSPSRSDWVLVVLGGLDAEAFPLTVSLQRADGQILSAGTLTKPDSAGGGGYLWHPYTRSLAKFNRILVTDSEGHVLMEGLRDRLVSHPGAV